jgi:hypothetical protein
MMHIQTSSLGQERVTAHPPKNTVKNTFTAGGRPFPGLFGGRLGAESDWLIGDP